MGKLLGHAHAFCRSHTRIASPPSAVRETFNFPAAPRGSIPPDNLSTKTGSGSAESGAGSFNHQSMISINRKEKIS